MSRPDFTETDDVMKVLPSLIGVPIDHTLLFHVSVMLAKDLKDNPFLANWYHLPVLSIVATTLRTFLTSDFYRAVPNEPAAAAVGRKVPEAVRDVVKIGRLDGELRAALPLSVGEAQIAAVSEGALQYWAEFDGTNEESWQKLTALVVDAAILGRGFAPT